MLDRQSASIAFRLTLGLDHCLRPARSTPSRGAALHARAGGLAEQVEIIFTASGGEPVGVAALLGLEDEGVALVAVDPAEAGGAITVVLKDTSFENIMVMRIVGTAAGWWIDAEQTAQAIDEALCVGELRAAGIAPCGDEAFDRVRATHKSS